MHCTRFASSPLRTGQLPNAISRRQTAAPAGSKQQGSPEREGPAAALSEPDPVHASRAACGSAAIETFLCIWAGRHYIFLKISLSSILLHALVHTPPGHFKQHDGQGLGLDCFTAPPPRTECGRHPIFYPRASHTIGNEESVAHPLLRFASLLDFVFYHC